MFGDPYVSDTYWTNHQRLHQYQGGHRETWGGITIDVDSSFVDGAVVGATGSAPPPTLPTPGDPTPTQSAAGSVAADDGIATVSWPAGAFQQSVVVTLTPTTPGQPPAGFGSGGYEVQLQVAADDDARSRRPRSPSRSRSTSARCPAASRPMTSTRTAARWKPLPPLSTAALPAGTSAGYVRNPDGSVDVLTTAPATSACSPS